MNSRQWMEDGSDPRAADAPLLINPICSKLALAYMGQSANAHWTLGLCGGSSENVFNPS